MTDVQGWWIVAEVGLIALVMLLALVRRIV